MWGKGNAVDAGERIYDCHTLCTRYVQHGLVWGPDLFKSVVEG